MTSPARPPPSAPRPAAAARPAGLPMAAALMALLASCLPEGEAGTGREAEGTPMTGTAPPTAGSGSEAGPELGPELGPEPGPGIGSRPAPIRSEPLPLPRDPDVAVREEFDAATAAGTAAGYGLFIDRHPDSPLAATARDRLAALGG